MIRLFITFLRCLEIAIDDLDFSSRTQMLRRTNSDLVAELAEPLQSTTRDEQSVAMLKARLQPLQHLLRVSGKHTVTRLAGAEALIGHAPPDGAHPCVDAGSIRESHLSALGRAQRSYTAARLHEPDGTRRRVGGWPNCRDRSPH